jgi:putative tryptophan/tyrosine transport system substrate-binding protein
MPVGQTRRAFIAALGGAVAWPYKARAQAYRQERRIGLLMLYPENDPQGQVRARAFSEELAKLGWKLDHDLRLNFHWGVGSDQWARSAAENLLKLQPDVIVANGPSATQAVEKVTRVVPVIFITGADPVAEGLVQSLAHPGGNMTGFSVLQGSVGGKLLEFLKEIAPPVDRALILLNPDSAPSREMFDTAADAAQKFAVEVIASPVRNSDEIEVALMNFASRAGGGLIVPRIL